MTAFRSPAPASIREALTRAFVKSCVFTGSFAIVAVAMKAWLA